MRLPDGHLVRIPYGPYSMGQYRDDDYREDAPHFMMKLSTDYDACRDFYSIRSSGRSLEFVFSIKWYHEIDGFVRESI